MLHPCTSIEEQLSLSGEVHALLAQLHITGTHDLRNDVGSIAKIVRDQIRLAILQLVDAELLRRIGLDVGELVVVIEGASLALKE